MWPVAVTLWHLTGIYALAEMWGQGHSYPASSRTESSGSYSSLTLILFHLHLPRFTLRNRSWIRFLQCYWWTDYSSKKILLVSYPNEKMISFSFGIIKIEIGKKDWVHNKAFQIWAAFKSYWTLILSAGTLVHESSLHPKHRKPDFPCCPLESLTHFSISGHYFLLLPMIFSGLFFYHPLLFSLLVQFKAVLVPLEALALVLVNLFSLPVQRAVNFNRHNITQTAYSPCFPLLLQN